MIVAVLLAVASVAAFPVLLGLHPTIGVVLATLVAGATIGIHRRLWPHERTLATRLGGGRLALSGVLGLLLIAPRVQESTRGRVTVAIAISSAGMLLVGLSFLLGWIQASSD